MRDSVTLIAGWAFPPGARRAHFFPEDASTSLCGKYGFQFNGAAREPDNGKPSKDDCAACRRKFDAASA